MRKPPQILDPLPLADRGRIHERPTTRPEFLKAGLRGPPVEQAVRTTAEALKRALALVD